ncbi:MAG: sulfite exporter TauE/SafE family protein [Proteobacteria bacterium]|nr:sulfite exporter TauE/SafE family protein [Pseudomonadota bacterium]
MFDALPQYPIAFWISALASVALIGISKAGFGAGIGVIATPLMALTISTAEAAALLLPILIISDFMAIQQYRARFDRRNLLIMVPGSILGIAAGWFFFGYFSGNERVLKIGIGILALSFVAFQLCRSFLSGVLARRTPSIGEGIFWSTISGFTSTLAHVGSPPALVYLLPQNLPRDIYVGTTIYFFMITNVIKLVPYAQLNLLRVGNLYVVFLLLPVALLGVKVGAQLNRRCSDTWFNRIVYGLLFLTGIQLILGGSFLEMLK